MGSTFDATDPKEVAAAYHREKRARERMQGLLDQLLIHFEDAVLNGAWSWSQGEREYLDGIAKNAKLGRAEALEELEKGGE